MIVTWDIPKKVISSRNTQQIALDEAEPVGHNDAKYFANVETPIPSRAPMIFSAVNSSCCARFS